MFIRTIRPPELVMVGSAATPVDLSGALLPACFYFIEGNVMFVFDYSPRCSEFFVTNAKKFPAIREVVFCFSDPMYIDETIQCSHDIMVKEFIEDVLPFLNIPDEMLLRMIELDKNGALRTWIYRCFGTAIYQNDISEYEDAMNVPTNRYNILLSPQTVYTTKGYCAYSVWMDISGYWTNILYYTGKQGTMNQRILAGLAKDHSIQLVYYINPSARLEHKQPVSYKTLCQKILNTFEGLENPIHIIGFQNIYEAQYIRPKVEQH